MTKIFKDHGTIPIFLNIEDLFAQLFLWSWTTMQS